MKQNDLIQKINDAANIIHNANLKRSGNFIIVNPDVADALTHVLDPEYKRKQREKKLKRILNFEK